MKNWAFLFCVVLSITSCNRLEKAKKLLPEGYQEATYRTDSFSIKSFFKLGQLSEAYIYIEGDGFAWRNRYQPSEDPTPKNPTALKMAVSDNASSVFYLARPCQYVFDKECQVSYWTNARFNQKVIDSYNTVLDSLKERYGFESFHIAGFSGGGVIAKILAYQREDVKTLITVASPLNHKLWTDYHKVSPLSGSINAADYSPSNLSLKQYHVCGSKDTVVPCVLTEQFVSEMKGNVELIEVPRTKHHCCWERPWPQLLESFY